MLSTKSIVRFIGTAILLFVLLILLFRTTGLDQAFGNLQRNMGKAILAGHIGSSGVIQFRKAKRNHQAVNADIEMLLLKRNAANPRGIPVTGVMIDSWIYGCLPFLFLLALIFATPLAWRDQLKAVLSGIALMFLFLLFKMWIHGINGAIKQGWIDNSLLEKMKTILEMITHHAGFSLVIAILIWFVVVVKSEQLKKVFNFPKL